MAALPVTWEPIMGLAAKMEEQDARLDIRVRFNKDKSIVSHQIMLL